MTISRRKRPTKVHARFANIPAEIPRLRVTAHVATRRIGRVAHQNFLVAGAGDGPFHRDFIFCRR